MDTSNMDHSRRKNFFSFLKVLIVMLIVLAGLKAAAMIKEYGYIGEGTVAANVITVSGKGEIAVTPDIAEFTFSVVETAPTAKDAQDKATTQANAALAAIKAAGVDDKDVKTLSYDIAPQYEYNQIVCVAYPCPNGKQTLTGYTVTQTIDVKVRDIDKAGAILAKITSLGVSNVSGLNFTVDNQDDLQNQARAKAIDDAQSKAKELAKELGVHLGKVTSFSDANGPIIYPLKAMSMDSAGATGSVPAPSLPTGENTITSNITVTYAIY